MLIELQKKECFCKGLASVCFLFLFCFELFFVVFVFFFVFFCLLVLFCFDSFLFNIVYVENAILLLTSPKIFSFFVRRRHQAQI